MKKIYFIKKVIPISLFFISAYSMAIFLLHRKNDKWNWEKIDITDIQFPKEFLWGTASAAYQVEGGHDKKDSWGFWENQKDFQGQARVKGKSGIANDEWRLYPKDIENMKWLGLNAYRFSLSWSKIEPQKGTINQAALLHYDKLLNTLLANGIEPMITLHHFSHPQWFEQRGAFDREKNIVHFLDFVRLVYDRYGDRVKFFTTFNEPVVYGYGRHIDLKFPNPSFEKADFQRLGKMLKNILIAHQKAYQLIKSLPNGQKAQVGIVKSMMQMDPMAWYDIGDQVVAYYANRLFLDSFLNYFSKGVFEYKAFLVGANVVYKNPNREIKSLDFIGLNYYSHYGFDFKYSDFDIEKASKPLIYKDEIPTDLDYGFYPEGLYRAIREISRVNVPIYITENGIGLSKEREDLRVLHLQTALYDISLALKENYPIKAFFYWSLNDNFEWESGFSKEFGLFSVQRDSLARHPKKTAYYFRDAIKNWRTKKTQK